MPKCISEEVAERERMLEKLVVDSRVIEYEEQGRHLYAGQGIGIVTQNFQIQKASIRMCSVKNRIAKKTTMILTTEIRQIEPLPGLWSQGSITEGTMNI